VCRQEHVKQHKVGQIRIGLRSRVAISKLN
jgi:hypothetical protein